MDKEKVSLVDWMDTQYLMSCGVELLSAVQIAIAEGPIVEGGYSDALYAVGLFMGEMNRKMLNMIDDLASKERKSA